MRKTRAIHIPMSRNDFVSRNQQIRKLHKNGFSAIQIGRLYGLTRRAIYYVLAKKEEHDSR